MKTITVVPGLPKCGDRSVRAVNLCSDRSGPDAPGRVLKPAPEVEFVEPRTSGARVVRPVFPSVVFSAVSERKFVGATPERRLSSSTADYNHWTGPVGEEDAEVISRDVRWLYIDLSERARSEGYYTQPVIVWYRILDASGREVGRSSPVLVGYGIQGLDGMSAEVARGASSYDGFKGVKMALRGFRLGMTVSAPVDTSLYDVREAVTMEVMVSRMLSPVALDMDAVLTLGAKADGSALMNVRMPRSVYADSMVSVLLDRLDSVSHVAARFSRPFRDGAGAGSAVVIPRIAPLSVEAESRAVLKSMGAADGKGMGCGLLRGCGAPHGFKAEVAVRVGDMEVYGCVAPLHASPPRLSDLAVDCGGAGAWAALVRVVVACGDGSEEVLSIEESSLGGMPSLLSPLIVYPLPNAVRMEIQVTESASGVRRVLSLPLYPTPGGEMSCYQSPDMEPIALSSFSVSSTPLLPVDDPSDLEFSGMIAVASSADSGRLVSALDVTRGRVTAVTPALRSSSAWDFARRHLYVFTTDGVYSAAVNASLTLSSAHLIDAIPVMSPSCVAYTPSGVYFLSSGSLWRVEGSRVSLVMPGVDADALCWDRGRGLLMCRRGEEFVVVNDRSESYVSRPADGGSVEWCGRIMMDGFDAPRLRYLNWSLKGSGLSLDIYVRGDNGDRDNPVDLMAVHVEGSVSAPVRCAVVARRFRFLTVGIVGSVGDDFELGKLMLLF